jgi:hypothetical protein
VSNPLVFGGIGVLVVVIGVPWVLGKTGRALAARWLLGQPMTGKPHRTDATWTRRGTKLTHRAPVRSWSYRPGWQRSAIRQLSLVGIGVIVWARLTHPAALIRCALAALLLAVMMGVWTGYRRFKRWHVERLYVQPLHIALSHALDLPADITPSDYIAIPDSWKKNPNTPVKVMLPPKFDASADNQARIGGLLLQKLGKSDREFSVSFSTMGQPYMVAKLDPKPPDEVLLTPELVAKIDKLGPSEIAIGIDAGNKLIVHNLKTESPHVGLCCESGAGKSSFLEFVVAQVIRKHKDNEARGIDPKYASLPGLAGVPNVRIACDPIGAGLEEMWAVIEEVAIEVMRRGEALKNDKTVEFPMLLLVIDEVNLLAAFSSKHWKDVLKGKGTPPLWGNVMTCLAAGRRFRVHVIIVGQDLRETALGGIGLRTMLGLRAIGGQFDVQQWLRFIQTRPVPRPADKPGRWNYRLAGRGQVWVQNIYATPEEVNALARHTLPSDRPSGSVKGRHAAAADPAPVTVTVASVRSDDARHDQGRQTVTEQTVTASVTAPQAAPAHQATEPAPALYSLAEAVREGIVPMSYDDLRQAKSRGEKKGLPFPAGTKVGKRDKWTAEQLTEWMQARLEQAISEPGEDAE